MVGGLCLSLGLGLSALQTSLSMMFAFFGIVAGMGLGLTYTASVVVISYYFNHRRTMVTGIALSSGGLGIMLGPQISTLLFQMFSWREALGMMSVVSAQVCVLGALMFPMHETETSPTVSRIHRALKFFFSRRGVAFVLGRCRRNANGRAGYQDCQHGVATKLVGDEDAVGGGTGPCQNGQLRNQDQDTNRYSEAASNTHVSGAAHDEQPLVQFSKECTTSGSVLFKNDNLADVNNSAPSLQTAQASLHHPQYHHHYFLKQHRKYRGHIRQRYNSKSSSSNLHSHDAHPKSQSFFELSTSSNSAMDDTSQIYDISQTFRSNRELSLNKSPHDQTNLHAKKTANQMSHSSLHSSEKEIHSAQRPGLFARSAHAQKRGSRDHQRGETSSSRLSSRERLGQPGCSYQTGSTGAASAVSTTHLHVTVVPHNPSLLSLAGSTHHLDLVVHKDNEPSSKENVLSSNDPLYRSLFGIDNVEPSQHHSSQEPLKSAQAKHGDPQASELKSEPKPAVEILSSSKISLSHAHNPISGKDPNRPLYRNGAFMLLCVQLFVANCACGVFNIHMPSFTMSKGLTDREVTNILSINGLALFNGRMLVGALASATGFDLLIYWALHMIGGLFIIILPVAATSYLNFCFLIYGVGTFFGSVYSVLTSLTLKYVGLSQLATAFGLEMVCAGLGYLLAPPVAGWLVDQTGSYDYDMYCGGALLILSALILMFLPILEPEVTREDIRRFLEGGVTLANGKPHGGIHVDVQVEEEEEEEEVACEENDVAAAGDGNECADDVGDNANNDR
ncbi:monocarboxylate transporter 12 [Elysia marginata]|uniref:Monocarboxylate transporter 12 n=1 Tax=Elysia marginata TaxID=1093978 RepID=A0AAV4EZR2_9GAST|nr:monocarboxylate transporter 12 [Elysia marginata]